MTFPKRSEASFTGRERACACLSTSTTITLNYAGTNRCRLEDARPRNRIPGGCSRRHSAGAAAARDHAASHRGLRCARAPFSRPGIGRWRPGLRRSRALSRCAGRTVDFSTPMLDPARRRFARRDGSVRFVDADYGVASWTREIAGTAGSPPFDAIVSGYSIHHQPDPRKIEIYREVFGLLAPGGIFLNVEHALPASPWLAAVHDELFIEHLHLHHAGQSRREVAETYYERPDKAANILAPVEAQCQWLREIGFTDVDCYLKIFELAVFGGRAPGVARQG